MVSQAWGQDFTLSPRASGIGGAFLAVADDPSAIYWNPAGLIQLKRPEIMLTWDDPFSLNCVSLIHFLPLVGTFALGLSRTPSDGRDAEAVSLAFGRSYNPTLSLGGAVALPKDGNPDLRFSLLSQPIRNKLAIGLSLNNIGSGGEDFSSEIGVSYFSSYGVLLACSWNVTTEKEEIRTGMEIHPSRLLRLRSGMVNFNRGFFGGGLATEDFDVDIVYSAGERRVYLSLVLKMGQPPDLVAERYYRDGLNHMKKGDYQRALVALRRCLAYDPYDYETARLVVGILQRRVKEREERLASLLNKAADYRRRGWYLPATLKYYEALKLDPENKLALENLLFLKPRIDYDLRRMFKRGVSFFNAGNYRIAKQIFEKILLVKKDHKEAIDYLTRIKAIYEKKAQDHFSKAMAYYRRGKWEEAKVELNKVLNYQPKHREAQRYLINTEKRIQKIKAQAALLLIRALEYEDKRQYVQAIRIYRDILKLDPHHEEARRGIERLRSEIKLYLRQRLREGIRRLKQGDLEEAEKAFRDVLHVEPEHEKARYYLEKTRQIFSSRVNSCYQRGLEYFNEGELEKAIQEFKRALALDPKRQEIREKLKLTEDKLNIKKTLRQARAFFEEGSYQQAMVLFRQVLDKEPDNAEALEYLKQCRTRLNLQAEEHFSRGLKYYIDEDYSSAIKEWEKALAINPHHQAALKYKQRALQKLKALEALP